MSPRSADPAVRTAVIEAAARILADEGAHSLTTRRLAKQVGTSTMAVYTHFGSMEDLRRAVRQEGFARLAADLDATPKSDDPVADLVAAGAAYLANGLANPHLYRAMFFDSPLSTAPPDRENNTFQKLVDAIQRCIDAGRFHQVDALGCLGWAVQLWSMRHGMMSLVLAGILPAEQLPLHLADMTSRLFVGYGDDRHAANRSVQAGLGNFKIFDYDRIME